MSKSKIVGVWDDHDMGKNDGGSSFILKDRNRDIYLDFIGEPTDSERRLQTGSAIHQDYFIRAGHTTVHVILLDIRYAYDKKTGDRVGPEQWQWLDTALKRGKAKTDVSLTVIGAGVSILSERLLGEKFTKVNKKKLFDVLKANEMSNVALISGDMHTAQFYENDCASHTGMNTLFEVASSGMTHTQNENPPFVLQDKNMEFVTLDCFVASPNFMELNYGMFEVPLTKPESVDDMVVRATIRGIYGDDLFSKEYSVSDLAFDSTNLLFKDQCQAKLSKQLPF